MRALPFLAALCFLALVLTLPAEDEARGGSTRSAGSSYETGPTGLSLARAYLASRPGTSVETLARPIGQARLPANAVVFRVLASPGANAEEAAADDGERDEEPTDEEDEEPEFDTPEDSTSRGSHPLAADAGVAPSRQALLTASEERWISSGGRLVVATARAVPEVALRRAVPATVRKHLPVLPSVHRLEPSTLAALDGPFLDRSVVVLSRLDAPIAVRRALGKGELWVLSNPELLDNAHLPRADHLALLNGLAGDGRPVLFDESFHGVEEGVSPGELLRRWGLGPSVLLVAVALGLAFWRRRRTLGPPAPWEDRRTESADLIESLSLLYLRALRPAQALALHRRRLSHELQAREHLSPEALEARISALLPGWTLDPERRLRDPEFAHRLAQLNDAFRRTRDTRHRR